MTGIVEATGVSVVCHRLHLTQIDSVGDISYSGSATASIRRSHSLRGTRMRSNVFRSRRPLLYDFFG
ncbi:hypothetical protein BT69DRAFT_536057 [Atractiella rhizophila]|nr:hypothetical protein BT69DRAFT_536057 [Atractiella rhizophila]